MQKQRININGYDDIKTRAHNVQFISVVLILCKKKMWTIVFLLICLKNVVGHWGFKS